MKSNIHSKTLLFCTGILAFTNTYAQWTENASSVFLTSGTKNVGIGTSAPAFVLDVQSSGNASASFKSATGTANLIIDRGNSSQTSSVSYRTAGFPTWQTGTLSTDNYVIRNIALGAPAIACVNATNNVGIGTAAPLGKLHVSRGASGATPVANAGLVVEANTSNYINILAPISSVSGLSLGSTILSNDAGMYYNALNNRSLDFRTGGNISRVTIDNVGRVGIGTQTPVEAKFVTVGDVGKTLAMFGKGTSGVSIVKDFAGIALNTYFDGTSWRSMSTGYGAQFQCDQNNGGVVLFQSSYGASTGSIVSQTVPFYISPLGNTSLGYNNVLPTEKLEVNGNIKVVNGDLYLGPLDGAINAGGGLMDPLINMMADLDNHSIINGDEDLYIEDDLEIGSQAYKPGGGSWTTISDGRLKKDVKNYTDGLAQLIKINPVSFKYNDKVKLMNPDKEYVGIIAQDMQKVAPYMVEEMALFSKSHETANGKIVVDDAGQNYLTYDGSALTYMLVNAVKELNTENQNLKQALDEIKACIAMLCNNNEKTAIQSSITQNGLQQNAPNPFSQTTTIKYTLNHDVAKANIVVRNLNGNEVKRLKLNPSAIGEVVINAYEFAQGTYTYSLEVNGTSIDTKLMVVTK